MPGSSTPSKNAANANPQPPAAPVPGLKASAFLNFRLAIEAYCASHRSILRIISSSAPFWGPKTALHPFSPHKGLVTSQAIRNSHSFSSGITSSVVSSKSFSNPPAPKGICRPFSSRNPKPRAWSIPTPPSFVALPPIPIKKRRQPFPIPSFINSPTP